MQSDPLWKVTSLPYSEPPKWLPLRFRIKSEVHSLALLVWPLLISLTHPLAVYPHTPSASATLASCLFLSPRHIFTVAPWGVPFPLPRVPFPGPHVAFSFTGPSFCGTGALSERPSLTTLCKVEPPPGHPLSTCPDLLSPMMPGCVPVQVYIICPRAHLNVSDWRLGLCLSVDCCAPAPRINSVYHVVDIS